ALERDRISAGKNGIPIERCHSLVHFSTIFPWRRQRFLSKNPSIRCQFLPPQIKEFLSTTFETIERNVRIQLVSMLGSAGFDPARDILGISVNGWAHGYAYDMSSHALFDQVYEDTEDVRYPPMQARKRFGRITIANADSAASAMLEAAVEQGYRAITELPV
ncbi:MAG: hypothetical protein ABGY43_17610, partial [bacterium]